MKELKVVFFKKNKKGCPLLIEWWKWGRGSSAVTGPGLFCFSVSQRTSSGRKSPFWLKGTHFCMSYCSSRSAAPTIAAPFHYSSWSHLFPVRLSELIHQLVARWCDTVTRGFSLWGKKRALLLKQGAQSATCLTCKTAAGAPGRFSLAGNLNKSYSVENPKGWREGREMGSARGVEKKDYFRCERPCERSLYTHTHTRVEDLYLLFVRLP